MVAFDALVDKAVSSMSLVLVRDGGIEADLAGLHASSIAVHRS